MNIMRPVEQLWISHFLSAPVIIKIKCLISFWTTFGFGFLPWIDWILENILSHGFTDKKLSRTIFQVNSVILYVCSRKWLFCSWNGMKNICVEKKTCAVSHLLSRERPTDLWAWIIPCAEWKIKFWGGDEEQVIFYLCILRCWLITAKLKYINTRDTKRV